MRGFCLLALAACAPTVVEDPVTADLAKAFRDFEVVHVEYDGTGMLPLGDVKLMIEKHDLRARSYSATGVWPAIETYRGTVDGDPSAHVRLRITDVIEGYYSIGDERFFVEPAHRYSTAAAKHALVVYREGDALTPSDGTCDHVDEKLAFGRAVLPDVETSQLRVLELATDADAEWVAMFGTVTAANAEILHILNMVEGAYEAQLGLTIDVVYQHAWQGTDPFDSGTTDSLLRSFRDHWNAAFPSVQRDAVHLFSGKPVAAGRGRAFIDVICTQPQNAYGLSGWFELEPAKLAIPAHELAHNVGAHHVDGGDCTNTVMNAQLTTETPLTFCGVSRSEISAMLNSRGACLEPRANTTRFDFDGNGLADVAVFRPSDGTWYVEAPGGFTAIRWGLASDRPVAADYDGDGKTDAAIYRDGEWWILYSSSQTWAVYTFGLAADIPVPADFDGDGRADLAVYRPSVGEWWVQHATGGHFAVTWGVPGDIPMAGDWDGDRRADFIVWRPSDSTWYRLGNGAWTIANRQWGLPGDIPVRGDFDGDKRLDMTVWRPSDGVWYQLLSSQNGAIRELQHGAMGDVPVAADYTGDGIDDLAIVRPSTNDWWIAGRPVLRFGLDGDIPVAR